MLQKYKKIYFIPLKNGNFCEIQRIAGTDVKPVTAIAE